MTFINWTILIGLLAVAVPVLIHLFNRRTARVVDWGAMQFLQGSLANRKRRVLLEELILLVLRCLLIAMTVLAFARPFAPATSRVSWLALLPLLLIAAIVIAISTIVARSGRWRMIGAGCAMAIAIAAIFVSRNEQLLQSRIWKNTSDQDVAIVIDGSSSMSVMIDGVSNFDRAISETRLLIDSLSPRDNVCLLVAGGAIDPLTSEPICVRDGPGAYLQSGRIVGGTFDPVVAIEVAAAMLTDSDNAAKKIVLITDTQATGWLEDGWAEDRWAEERWLEDQSAETADEIDRVKESIRWQQAAGQLNLLSVKPKVIARFLASSGDTFENVSVASLELSRAIVGCDRDVSFRIRIENTGSCPLQPVALQIRVDDRQVDSTPVAEIAAGQSRQVNLKHRFKTSGVHEVTAELLAEDDMVIDNTRSRIVQVLESLPVLLVEGSARDRDFERASTYAEIALSPTIDRDAGESSEDADVFRSLIRTDVISTAELARLPTLQEWQIVMLCDVARMTPQAAELIADFVERGGGLLVAPGNRANSDFYNNWKSASQHPVLPASLQIRKRISRSQQPQALALESISFPALKLMLEDIHDSLSQLVVTAYWQLQEWDPSAKVDADTGARLENGCPLIVSQQLGKGKVVLTAVSLDTDDSNLPLLHAFLPLMQNTVVQLAAPQLPRLNFESGEEVNIYLPSAESVQDNNDDSDVLLPSESDNGDIGDGGVTSETMAVRVFGPGQTLLVGQLNNHEQQNSLRVQRASQQGVYKVELGDDRIVKFSITDSDRESRMDPIDQTTRDRPGEFLNWFPTSDSEQMIAAVTGEVPGQELWKYLAIGAIFFLLAESCATRWIALQRKTGAGGAVPFVSEGERIDSFQEKATRLLRESRSA